MMTDVAFFLAATFAAGLVMSLLRLPALLGFLAAGFLLNSFGVEELPWLDFIADLGVALLLWPLVGRSERWLLVGVGVVLTVAVALDRVFLGVHYPSDVLAGVVFGGGFVAAASRLWPRR